MSLHRSITDCGHRDEGGQRFVFWTGRCECGWEGDPHEGGSDADLAKRDYRLHVEGALGAGAYYPAPVACRNCGSEHEQGILIGTPVYENACERCGVKFLNPNNVAWHEDHERAKRWSW